MSTLFELNEHIRRIMALNFPQALWVTAEVAQIGESRGHYYLELVQKGENQDILAQASAIIWASEYRQLLSKHGMELHGVMREGLALKLQVRPDFHERYGLKLQIQDIDPAFTLGQLDLQRRQTVQALKAAGLYDKNRALPLPEVLQRIAVISSETAAGLQDFRHQLEDNNYGYQFDLKLFPAAMQGKNSEQELVAALQKITKQSEAFDCVVIVRGGGSRLDLASFDGLELCSAVGGCPLPVLAGIGHDVDESVLDLVANRALKTPTAVAEFLIQHNLQFESQVQGLQDDIQLFAANALRLYQLQLEQALTEVRWSTQQRLQSAEFQLEALAQNLPVLSRQFLRNQQRAMEQIDSYCAALHPDNVLRRGFSLTTKNGKALSSVAEIVAGDMLETRVQDGVVVSRVE